MNALSKILKNRAVQSSSSRTSYDIPTLEEVSGAYAALAEQRRSLGAELGALRKRLMEETTWIASQTPEVRPTEQATRVAEILGEPAPQQPKYDSAMASIRVIEARVSDLEAAIKVVDGRLDAERRKASHVVCEQISPLYRELVASIAGKLLELHTLVVDYETFADDLNERRIMWSQLWAMPVMFASSRDSSSPVARWLRDAADHKFISRTAIPESLR